MPKSRSRGGRTFVYHSDEDEAAIQRGIAQDPGNPEWTAEDFQAARAFPEVMTERRTDYRVVWSDEDKQHVGLCGGFPSLSWLDDSPEAALAGIRRIVAETIAELTKEGVPLPPNRP